jgi:hypothetical protein
MSEQTEAVQCSVAAVPVSWEAVRALAMVVGVREAARRMGLSEDQVRQRSSREKWLATDQAKRAVAIANAERTGKSLAIPVSPMSPAALISAELAQLGSKSRLSLARGVAKATEHVENMQGSDILAESGNVKAIAQTADLVHGWKDSAPQVKIRLDVLGGSGEAMVDIEATEIDDVTGSWSDDSDVDSY